MADLWLRPVRKPSRRVRIRTVPVLPSMSVTVCSGAASVEARAWGFAATRWAVRSDAAWACGPLVRTS